MRAPSLILLGDRPPLWREARVGLEAAALLRDPIFRGDGMTDGRGRPVLLIPGFLAGDGSLSMMAGWLKRAGYRPSRAGIVANVNCAGTLLPRLEERLERLVSEQGRRPRSSARAAVARSPRCSHAAGRTSPRASWPSAPRRSTRSRCIRWFGSRSRPLAAWDRWVPRASSSAPASTATAARRSGRTSPRRCRAG